MRQGFFTLAFLLGLVSFSPAWAGDASEVSPDQLKAAIGKSLPLLEKSALNYMEYRQCFSCHHQALPIMALAEAKKRGWHIQEDSISKVAEFTADSLKRGEKNYRKGQGQGGAADTAGYALFALEMGGWKPDSTTEAVAEYLLLHHSKDRDFWQTNSNRPPTEASRFTTTYVALRGLLAFGGEKLQDRIEERKNKVRPWVINTKPKDTEDRVFRLRTLKVLDVEKNILEQAAQDLLQQQRQDGGWGQLPQLDSDAYATGSALAALHQAGGLPVSDPAYQRGLKYLVEQQLKDGSWYVKSRSKPFQLYFESGFPHGKDQFISCAASSWAAVALLQAYQPLKK